MNHNAQFPTIYAKEVIALEKKTFEDNVELFLRSDHLELLLVVQMILVML